MLHVAECRQHHHGDEHGRAVLAKLAADLKAGDVRKHQVQEQNVRKVLPGQTKSGLAILDDGRLEIAESENPSDNFCLFRIVFHDQSRCHRSVPCEAIPCLNPPKSSCGACFLVPSEPNRTRAS